MNTQRRLVICGVVIGLGLALRQFGYHLGLTFWTVKYGGSVLWGAMVYLIAAAASGSRRTLLIGSSAFVLASLVELSRLYHAPGLDAFRISPLGAILLGRVFSPWNILAYAFGIGLGMALDILTRAGTQQTGAKHRAMRQRIIVFDAKCVLCSANAQFVLRRDRAGAFLLASMQGEVGAGLYRKFGIDPANPETLIVVDGETALRNSDAVLAIYAGLGWPWRALAVLRLVPQVVRDRAYLLIARHRYRLFGRRETCWTPTPDQARRVL